MSEVDDAIKEELAEMEFFLCRFLENYDDEHNKAIELGTLVNINGVLRANTALLRKK
jgi:hypothetical protein